MFLVALFSGPTIAGTLGEQTASSLDALEKANAYSFGMGSINIGIVMSYGKKNGVTAEQIGDLFVNEFLKRGVKARYFYYNTDRDDMAISYRIGHSSLGPWNVDNAGLNVSKAVARAEAANRIHFGQ